jgi:hypothetical protein
MSPIPGDDYLLELGIVAKEGPMVVVARHDPEEPELSAFVFRLQRRIGILNTRRR